MIEVRLCDDARRALRDRVRALPADGDARIRTQRMRALLQELGVSCDDKAEFEELDAVLLASANGTEALVAARLDDEQRAIAYARLLARMLADEFHAPLDAKMEYTEGLGAPPKSDRERERMVIALAHAILDGDLDAAPRPLYEDVPMFTLAFTPRSAARSTLGGFHLWSDFWYRRSNMYRRWRSRRDVSSAIRQVCTILTRVSVPAA